ncbi:low specificity L-threonine aldolase [uncultured Roseovarius sp.]|uniref:threonine aldolase family protein n=1 Tax=uncultured Roseovarius sp. TaxID=293344 RepID=UPI002620977A|nr:beta-eliminating lyase-related protein [uncultured Roseovarius sp.]
MYFASDNTGPALPAVLKAVTEANTGYQPSYGEDQMMAEVRSLIRSAFEAPDAAVYLVATGTAANALALSTLAHPWQTIFCTPLAHVHTDECHAPEFFTGGAKLSLVGESDRMTPEQLAARIESWTYGDVHVSQRGPVSITQVTEMGHVYSLNEINTLTSLAKTYRLPVHMDGARFANALAALDCTPAEMTWRAGIDVLSFGGTKNGCMGVEAVVFFDPKHAWEFELRRKRAAHLFSKHRYLSAQMLGYLRDGLWRETAKTANAACARLTAGLREVPGAEFQNDPQANMIFATLPRATHQRLHDAGAAYGLMAPLKGDDPAEALPMRLVCDWSMTDALIDQFLEIAKG